MSDTLGIVKFLGYFEKDSCGYCQSDSPNFNTHGMWAYRLSAKAYQLLIDRGWRRSGQYCYKPFLKQSCCPAYTIRCEALNVKVTRSQKKVIKRMNQFLQHDHRPKNWNRSQRQDPDMDSTKDPLLEMQDHVQAENIFLSSSTATASRMGPVACVSTFRTEYNTVDKTQAADTINVDDLKLLMDKVKSHSSKAKCKRMLKHVDRLIRSAHIDELAAFGRMRQKHLQRIDRCNAEDTLELLLHSSPSLSEAKHKLEIKIVPSNDPETIRLSHKVFQLYQKHVHHDKEDEISFHQFEHFLVENPFYTQKQNFELIHTKIDSNLPTKYGGYFMQYWLDKELIAVGVIDILPICVSSVYFFYNPQFEFLSLGVYSALREIELARRFNQINPNIQFYYMGFYIHDIQKMKYKSNYRPSYLLCPETYTFHPISACLTKLDCNKYSRFCDDTKATTDANLKPNCDRVMILYKDEIYYLSDYLKMSAKNSGLKPIQSEEMSRIRTFASLIGQEAQKEILYWLKSG